MKPEDKELLLKDLCARLPYIPIIKIEEHDWNNLHIDAYDTPFKSYYLEPFIIGEIEIKPYLRPISSMTVEEICKIENIIGKSCIFRKDGLLNICTEESILIPVSKMNKLIQFMYLRHLDINGLIPKGLALEAKEGMYK